MGKTKKGENHFALSHIRIKKKIYFFSSNNFNDFSIFSCGISM